MDALRFGWLGHTRRMALESLLATLLEEWSRHWWLGHASAQFTCEAIGELDAQARLQGAFVASSTVGTLAVHAGTRQLASIGRHLALVVTDQDEALASSLGEQALVDLAASIHRRAGHATATEMSRQPLPASLSRADMGAFAVSVTLGRLSMVVLVDRSLGERLAPPTAVAAPTLVARRDALQHAAVNVSARLDFGDIDLACLAGLAVGEVLVADRKLDEALIVEVEGKGAVASGYLRRSGNQRAIVLDGVINTGISSP
ncbi:FliM/FliN family flagellar motor C-terminal domain-containing protein [Dyella sp.]|uniref:FliM/FliN family flagellar motor C-terminal domain-containing protein n=1 Tax=Dyella sp. TaxID=1869338 RepID=UPI002ED2361C